MPGWWALRTSFLVTVAGESLVTALLQAVVLSAISAGLVFLGSAVMARTRPLRLSRAQARARRARQSSQASETAWRRAGDKLERHLGVLHRQLIRQPLYSSVPSGMTHPEWVDVLDHVLRAQLRSGDRADQAPGYRPHGRHAGKAVAMKDDCIGTLTWDKEAVR